MKKVIISVLIACTILFMFAGCGEDKPAGDGSGTNSVSSTQGAQTDNSETPSTDNPATKITVESVLAATASPEKDFFCDEDTNGDLILIEYLGSDEIVVIPETINGKPIVTIGQLVFANNSSVKAIKISNSVKHINKGAFGSNKNLQIVIFGNDVETIAEATFQGCSNLTDVELNKSLKEIGKLAFAYCESLKEIEIPASVTEIDNSFFGLSDGFTIISEAGSKAEEYAKSAGINFRSGN